MKIFGLIVTAFTLFSMLLSAEAQNIDYKIFNVGVLSHSKHGKGVEMQVIPTPMPEGGVRGDIIQSALPNICKFYAPKVIAHVKSSAHLKNPKYIAVRVLAGTSAAGQYVLNFYSIENGTCGKQL